MKYSAAFAWENKLLNGLQMQPVFLSLLSRVNGCGNPFSRLLVIARGFSPAAIRSLLREITDSFVLRAQNDKLVSCCECHGVCSKLSLCHCEHRKVRGNPFFP